MSKLCLQQPSILSALSNTHLYILAGESMFVYSASLEGKDTPLTQLVRAILCIWGIVFSNNLHIFFL